MVDAKVLANEVVEAWIAAGKMPQMAWGFRELCEAAIIHARLRDRAASTTQPEADAIKTLERISHVLNTCQVRWPGDTVLDYISALVTAGLSRVK